MGEQWQEPAVAESAQASALAGELRVVLGRLVRRLREQAHGHDLTKSQTSVLLRLEREGSSTTTELARTEGVRPQSMAKTVRVLEEAGLVSGSPTQGRPTDPAAADRGGGGAVPHRAAAKEDWLTHAIGTCLTPDEAARLAEATELLDRLARTP
ncbi:MarR family transcriptional regulator [Streptacidiphilus sp. 4-A2]|nr:MarR family transcriptional regulator [Streptacidiphilus sp. 4-A2]